MRVVQVSAHYPPNFTSGGTLVPQRVARGMVRRGHESWVYAGRLDASEEPLTTLDEMDEAGVRIRWVNTTPWTAWGDTHNFDNPAVADDFASWLGTVRPDVVHIHSLQTLGGELVSRAKASGAAVVVTMHDFWWSCARQFLVAPDLQPCTLVVDCGECPCSVDHPWLERRDRRLAGYLADADVVLAPSGSALRVLRANGVDPERLRVDENGVPFAPSPALSAAEPGEAGQGPLRLMFAGGRDPMKGVDVLFRALGRLDRPGGWTCDLYGVDRVPASLATSGAVAKEAYAPDALGRVLGEHDVLVLPSVMRESHSILTREALAAGLAVVCTDTLGPEEAVDDGRNGLVVPAGDDMALAAALRRLVDDPGLVQRMRREPPKSAFRSVEEQVLGLEELYAELAEGASAPVRSTEEHPVAGPDGPTVASESSRIVQAAKDGLLENVLFVVGINGAPLRYRAHLPAEALATLGTSTAVVHYRDPRLPDLVAHADAVVFYRVPATEQVLALAERIRSRPRPVPILFDVDDLIFDPSLRGSVPGLHGMDPAEERLWWRGVARYRTTMELADLYVASTKALCDRGTEVTGLPSRLVPNGVGRVMGARSERALRAARSPGPLRIGYFSGTTTHDADWAYVEPAVISALQEFPTAQLWLGGHLRPTPALDEFADRVRRVPMMHWTQLPRLLRDVDVNLAPLVPGSIFNEAKSAIKWLEAALVATPTVATPTQPFADVIEDGRTGRLATSVDEWSEALSSLLGDEVARARQGSFARREALLRFSPHQQAWVYRDALRAAAEVARSGAPRAGEGWEPVTDDEPLSAAHAWVEQYPPVDGAPGRASTGTVATLRRKAAAASRVYRVGGVSAVVGKGRETLARRLSR